MVDYLSMMRAHFKRIYAHNPFVALLGMEIAHMEEGNVELSMPVVLEKHTNLYQLAHGGALAGLADTVMGVACATLGKRVVTLDMNINYVKGAVADQMLRAQGKVVHNGNKTMVTSAEVYSASGELVVLARATFFVIGNFEVEDSEIDHD